MLQRCLLLSSIIFSLSACCTTPLPAEDFSSVEATLGTFQGAFNSDEKGADELAYACISQEFKEQNFNFDLEQFAMIRRQALDANPFLSLLMSLRDLRECITNKETPFNGDPDLALMELSVAGRKVDIFFRRETVCQLEYRSTTDKEKRVPSIAETLVKEENGFSIRVDGLNKSWISHLPSLRRIVLEEQWKFADVEILEYGKDSPQL